MEASGSERLILVVDDDRASLALTRTVLEEAGHRVLAAGSAEEAHELLAVERPSLVLTDLELPGESGLELARSLTEDPRTAGIPIVCLTAHALPGTEISVYEAGCADYITKPVDIDELVRRVDANLRL